MKSICNQCQAEMIDDCSVKVERSLYGFIIKQKGKGLFKSVSAKPKARVCPNCGNVIFYIEEYKDFAK
ncbi:hypothetical protein [Clostridium sp.]|jgi:hypothetical protein|uniref:hypothetical protein n=1 Tax=Clostridium sp. TaxID=1506 RepID=UPI003EEBFD14